jgi:hypothetical protein
MPSRTLPFGWPLANTFPGVQTGITGLFRLILPRLVSIIAETECDAANGTDQSCFHLLVGTPQGTVLRPLGKKFRKDISSEFRKLADRRMLTNHVIACGECTIIKNPCAIFKSNSRSGRHLPFRSTAPRPYWAGNAGARCAGCGSGRNLVYFLKAGVRRVRRGGPAALVRDHSTTRPAGPARAAQASSPITRLMGSNLTAVAVHQMPDPVTIRQITDE